MNIKTPKKNARNKSKPFVVTKVLYVRNLPHDANQDDLLALFTKFGSIRKVLLLISKSHAFVEF